MEKTARIEKLRQSALDKFTGIEEFLYYFYEKWAAEESLPQYERRFRSSLTTALASTNTAKWDVKCPDIGSRRMRKRRNGSGSSEKTRPVK